MLSYNIHYGDIYYFYESDNVFCECLVKDGGTCVEYSKFCQEHNILADVMVGYFILIDILLFPFVFIAYFCLFPGLIKKMKN